MVVRIGTSGWSYDHWHPELYPPGLPVRDRLARIRAWSMAGRDVFVYFNNDGDANAVRNALTLRARLGEIARLNSR